MLKLSQKQFVTISDYHCTRTHVVHTRAHFVVPSILGLETDRQTHALICGFFSSEGDNPLESLGGPPLPTFWGENLEKRDRERERERDMSRVGCPSSCNKSNLGERQRGTTYVEILHIQ